MFKDCPVEVKKMIFARVRFMDLYEVSVVSQEWWTLTMATCSTSRFKYYEFMGFSVDFCNKMMPKEKEWQRWMFVEFTDEKAISIVGPREKETAKYCQEKGIRVRKLDFTGEPSMLPELQQLFPDLQILEFNAVFLETNEPIELPNGLKHLRLIMLTIYPRSHVEEVLQHYERVNSLYLISSLKELRFDNISFSNLKRLYLDMSHKLTQDMKSLFIGSNKLSDVYLIRGQLDKEWRKMFPENIQRIHLDKMGLPEEFRSLLGAADGFVERNLMKHVCQDWTKIRIFKSSNLCGDDSYKATYVGRPPVDEEELEIRICRNRIPGGLLGSEELDLKVLKLREDGNPEHLQIIKVPMSVEHFEWTANQFNAINFAQLFEDISEIKTLRFNSIHNKNIQFGNFPRAVNLVSLGIPVVDDKILTSIIKNCPSLKQLSLQCLNGRPFDKLPAALKSSSVMELTIIEPKDSIAKILRHFPCLVALHLQNVNMETFTMADLPQLTINEVEFVRISFQNIKDLDLLKEVVNNLDNLGFSHLLLGFLHVDSIQWLSCVMGGEKAFFGRYLASSSVNDFTKMNIEQLSDCFLHGSLLYVKKVTSLHLSSSSENYQITHDVQEFIANVSAQFQRKSKK